METDRVRELFERASKLKAVDDREVKEARQYDGILAFKRAVLGRFWRRKKILSLDELAQVFVKIGMASDEREGKSIVFQVNGTNLNYGNFRYLRIEKTEKGIYEYLVRDCRF